MRKLSEAEILSLTTILKMETDGLDLSRPMYILIGDEDLKRQAEAGLLGTEGKIKAIQQFIVENEVPIVKEEK